MMNSKRLTELTRMWQKMAAMKLQIMLSPRSDAGQTSSIANKGHSVVYTTGNLQFTVLLEYLRTSVFRELLRMSEEEFGLLTDGPITLPCHSNFQQYVISLLRGSIPEGLEKALLTSLAAYHCSASSSFAFGWMSHQRTLVYSY